MPSRHPSAIPELGLPAFHDDEAVNVIVETTQGSRNKYTFDERLGMYRLGSVLPAGASFPYDFGFVPSTLGGDGDPLDVLLLMDEPAFAGCLVEARLIGVIEAEQTERNGDVEKNDRLIAVAAESRSHHGVQTLDDVSANLLHEIEHFFVSYNEARGKRFTPGGREGPERAIELVREGERRFRKKHGRKKKSR